jgi:hypothetical protein
MRDQLDAPTESIPDPELLRVRAFLDEQSRVDLAVWVRHAQTGPQGPVYDHHLVLGVADDDYSTGDMGALEFGIGIPHVGWLDIFPLSEVDALRPFGTVVWSRDELPRTGDPLDFRLTWEPLRVEPDVNNAFADRVRLVEGVTRIEAAIQRLWKDGSEVRHSSHLFVDFHARRPHDFAQIRSAANEAGVVINGITAGAPNPDVQTTILYEAAS